MTPLNAEFERWWTATNHGGGNLSHERLARRAWRSAWHAALRLPNVDHDPLVDLHAPASNLGSLDHNAIDPRFTDAELSYLIALVSIEPCRKEDAAILINLHAAQMSRQDKRIVVYDL